MAGQMWDLAATPIGKAIETGDVDAVNRLVKDGENILFRDRKHNTYIHYVCTMYRPSVFYALVALGIDISAQNRHGNTALHVTALQRDSGHVSDLMCCGIDPALKNKDGKMAEELGTQNRYWHMIFERYKPGIFQAVKDHDIARIKYLLRCWVRVDCSYRKQNLRQFAACHKFHDIVVIIDEHKPTNDMIYALFEGNYEKMRVALSKIKCRVNFINEISAKKHILQYAIKFRNVQFVQMLCDAGADVNTQVRVNNYFWGPLYYEAFHKDVPLEMTWYIIKSGADFSLKDERGRTAFMYALDRVNGEMPLEMFQYMLKRGSDITQRDCTGCNPRDIARFARRRDVVELIDKYYIKIIRSSDCLHLTKMAIDGYDSLMIKHNYRDTFIYASGNRGDEVLQFIEWLPRFSDCRERLHRAIELGDQSAVMSLLHTCVTPESVIIARNKARRTPLMVAVLFDREDTVRFLLQQPYSLDVNATDCCNRTAYHFACCLEGETGERIRERLIVARADTHAKDVRGRTGADYIALPNKQQFIEKERQAVYGLTMELVCADKYEDARKLIRSKKRGLQEFTSFIKEYKFPITGLHKVLSPLMANYRDLIFLAIDYGKVDIVHKLVNLGADLCRKEKYEKVCEDGQVKRRFFTPAMRASHLGMADLAQYLVDKQRAQIERTRNQQTLLPRRAISAHLDPRAAGGRCKSSPPVFVTQLQRCPSN